jgi:SAM-dependent methyltransferase
VTRAPNSAGYFDRVYADGPDPWRLREQWYERRKRAVLLAALPAERYERAFEPGCATGALTEELATRCDRVVATERSSVPLAEARRRLGTRPGVVLSTGVVPEDWPQGCFDLVVLSELGYYFDAAGLRRLLERVRESVTEGGTIAAVHWRHPAEDHARSGDSVHRDLRTFARAAGWSPVTRTVEPDFALDVFVAGPFVSVATADHVPGVP